MIFLLYLSLHKSVCMSNIKIDRNNYRIHDDKNKRLIRKSLEECGAGRSILFDNDDCIIAGNGVYEQAQELGLKVRVIESDGTELIAIKRKDLSTEDARRKALALADNHTSDTSFFDFDAIVKDFGVDELETWELEINEAKDYSDKNREIDVEEWEDAHELILKFDAETYLRVKESLMTIDSDPSKAVCKLLFENVNDEITI
nr:MAG TPA: ParB protein [Caudoviricetes sp.]